MKAIVRIESHHHYSRLCSGMILTAFFLFATVRSAAGSIWKEKADMLTPRFAMGIAVADGKIYTIGGTRGPGNAGLSVLEMYDPAADTWTRKADMPTPRTFLSACAANGKIYALGGTPSIGQHCLATVEEYDPHSDSWRRLSNMPTERAGLCAVAVDGIIYAIGGLRSSLAVVPTVEAYDPETDTWIRKANIPLERTFMSAGVVAGKIYILGGGTRYGAQPITRVDEYDPLTDTWTRKANMPVAKFAHAGSAVGGMVFTIGGLYAPGSTGKTSVEAYDTATDTWSTFTDMPSARDALATATVDGKIYAMGGRFSHPGTLALSAVEEFDPFPLYADFNGDGVVDINDLLRLIRSWGQNDPSCDIGPIPFGDGTVDAVDLEVLMSCWGQEVQDDSLAAHWKLDETEGVTAHDSAGENDATVIGVPAWQPVGGAVDGALEFDGTTFAVADFVLNPQEGPFSVLAWVKGGAPGQVILSQHAGANWLLCDPATGALMTDLKRGGRLGRPLSSGAMITDGNWHRINFVWDGAKRALYVDDLLVAEDVQAALAEGYGGLNIGCGKDLSAGTFFAGLIDDVRIYKRAVRP